MASAVRSWKRAPTAPRPPGASTSASHSAPRAAFTHRITATGLPYGAIGIAYYDLLNRVFRQETEGFDGSAVLADTEFNALGQVSRSSRPYFDGTLPGNIQWTTQSYDTIGRLVSAITPDGGITTSGFNGLSDNRIDFFLGSAIVSKCNASESGTFVRDESIFGQFIPGIKPQPGSVQVKECDRISRWVLAAQAKTFMIEFDGGLEVANAKGDHADSGLQGWVLSKGMKSSIDQLFSQLPS